MDFLSNLFLSVTMFFGFGGAEPEPVALPVEEVEMVETAASTSEESMAMDSEMPVEIEETIEEEEVTIEPDNIEEAMEEEIDLNTTMNASAEPTTIEPDIRTMIVAGGCFWCVEADLEKVPGVIEVVSGYSGGSTDNPTYQDYGSGGHREVVEVTYDANKVSFEDILIVTMKTTDPTDDDGTFADRGDKYSSAFYYEDNAQKKIIEDLIAEVNENGPYDNPLAIDVEPRAMFWPAEDYHQNYYKGTLSQVKYKYYRNASGRDDFIEKYWGVNDHSPELSWRARQSNQTYFWSDYQKPSKDELKTWMDPLAFRVTQEDGTERSNTSPLDKNWEDGIYVDILSGEPLFSSRDKFDSGTGWPSFVRPIIPSAVTEHADRKLFTVRTEIRSAIADNHIGHVFDDGPTDSTGLRYCMNGAALRFIPKADMEAQGYRDFLSEI
tara:strand:+ start:1574 stop:2884 length:1311 start_codon:yes stop_codon:yes gene_type:complete